MPEQGWKSNQQGAAHGQGKEGLELGMRRSVTMEHKSQPWRRMCRFGHEILLGYHSSMTCTKVLILGAPALAFQVRAWLQQLSVTVVSTINEVSHRGPVGPPDFHSLPPYRGSAAGSMNKNSQQCRDEDERD